MSDFKINPEKYSKFQVTVMMERQEIANNAWTDASWKALGVMIDSRNDPELKHFERVFSDGDIEQYLWSGLRLATSILVVRASSIFQPIYHDFSERQLGWDFEAVPEKS